MNKRFVVFVCDPAGGFFLKIDGLPFLVVTLPWAFFVKKLFFSTFLESHAKLSLVSMLELLVLKNLIQRTSQRVKWTSGARVTIDRSLGNRQKIGSREKYRVTGKPGTNL